MGKKDRQSMEELWSKRFDEEAEFNEEEPLSRKAKREREKSISPILTVTLIFMALLIILPTSAYLWWSSRDGLSEEPTSPSVEQVAENEQDEDLEESDEIVLEETEESDTSETEEEDSLNETEEVSEADEVSSEEPSESATESAGSETAETGADETGSDTEDTDDSQEEVSSSDSADTESSTESETDVEEEPASEPVPAESADYYTVEAGDNMYRIALNHGMTTEELMQLNGIQEETVYVGQELKVN